MEACLLDNTLIESFLDGDDGSFDAIYDRYSGYLYRSAYLITGNRADAEDALQETFVRLYRRASTIKDPSRLKYWLLRIVMREAVRAAKSGRREIPDENAAELYDTEAAARSAPDSYEETELRSDFEGYLSRLSPPHREVLVLYYYNELSVREIAALTGSLEGTVKSRLFHARRDLKCMMKGGDLWQQRALTI